jgi:histidinol-phosphate aminotransferase
MMNDGGESAVTPRASVADAALVRPDWIGGVPRDPHALWLDKNENPDPILAALTARILREVEPEALWSYPECGPLYRKLAVYLGVAADRLVLAAGSDGVIRAVFEAFVEAGDVVIHTAPTFAMYPVYARMYGARALALAYEASDDGPRLPVGRVVDAVETARPKLVCLPNPDSPTGTVFDPDELAAIVAAAATVDALVLVDEAYHPFHERTALGWIETHPHLVVARTFAKAWGLAGLRIGYAAASPAVARLLHKVRPMYEVTTVAVAVVERMLDHADAVLASVHRLVEGRDAFAAAMRGFGFRTLRSHGNFQHVAFGAREAAVHAALEGVVLYRRAATEACLRGFSRFSAASEESLAPVIARIAQTAARAA